MTNTQKNEIYLSSSPHFTKGTKTQYLMMTVLIALLPECVYGVILFGLRALITICVSVVSAVVFEALFQLLTKKEVCVTDLSAAVTGVLLALVCPPTIPIWMVVLGAFFAVVVAKGLFGGLGANVFNPALTGRAFMFVSFSSAMGASWMNLASGVNKWDYHATGVLPLDALSSASIDAITSATMDAVTSATPLSQIKAGTFVADADTYLQFFLGNRSGCIGETSILLILISFIFLLVTHVIDWRAPLTMVATVAVATFVSSCIGYADGAAAASEVIVSSLGDVLLALLTGGLLFGATFMVTDYATTPVTKPGRLVFGFGCGLITFLIRRFGGYPEGVMFSILIMNALAPFLNYLKARKYGYGKKGHAKPTPKFIMQEFDTRFAKSADASAKEEAAK